MLPLSDRTKKLLLAVLFLAIVLGIAVAIYATFFRANLSPTSPTPGGAINSGATLPTAGKATTSTAVSPGGTGTLPDGTPIPGAGTQAPGATVPTTRTEAYIDTQTQFSSANSGATESGLRFYSPTDGKFYRANELGDLTPLSDKSFYNVKNVSWASKSDKAVLEFPDGSNVFYNFSEDRQVTLPKHWEDFTFSPSDDQIVAKSMGNNESNRYLVVSNPDGSDPKAVQELGNNGDKVTTVWSPNSQVIAYANTGDSIGYDREQVILVGQNHENLPGLITEGRGFLPSWSPQGKSLLYSIYTSQNGYLPELWVSGGTADTINSNRRRLNLNTWANKCTWSSETLLYCAVPSSLEAGAALQPDAVQKGTDQIFRINLQTGTQTNLGVVDTVSEVQSMTLSTDKKTAYAVDKATGKVVRFNINN